MAYPQQLSIVIYGNPILQQRAKEVSAVSEEQEALAKRMFELMYASHGVGLAAPQVGISERIIVLDGSCVAPAATPKALANPVILKRSRRRHVAVEGCLSLPGIEGQVPRAWQIRVRAIQLGHGPVEFDTEGFEARIIQHELDHLDGVLFIDRLPCLKRRKLKRLLSRQLAQCATGATTRTEQPALL